MYRRHYTVRYNAERRDWELFRGASDRQAADVVASYPTQEAAISGCESICAQIVAAGMAAYLHVKAENGSIVAERTFGSEATS